ncbi:hypothetical protein BH23GEM11_BH23GEM11_14440 [soil metagenome]
MIDFPPDPALAGVVRPMILQFFVLAVLWMHVAAPWTVRKKRVGDDPPPEPAPWTAVLLPFLMIATGLLFFSLPLQPVWAPLLGPGGNRVPAIPAEAARATVLAMNLAVVGWCAWRTGGFMRSPLAPLLVSIPFAALLVDGAGGGWLVLGAGIAAVVVTVIVEVRAGRDRAGAGVRDSRGTAGRRRIAGTAGVLFILGIAAWLGWSPVGDGGAPLSPLEAMTAPDVRASRVLESAGRPPNHGTARGEGEYIP